MASSSSPSSADPDCVVIDSSSNEDSQSARSVSFDLLKSCHQVALDKWSKQAKQR